MRNIKKPLGILFLLALCTPGFVSMVEAKTNSARAQEISPIVAEKNLNPTKWEAIDLIGRGRLAEGAVLDATFTQEELNGLIEGLLASKNISWFVDNASVKLSKGKIDFSGRMLRPVKGNLVVNASVVLEEGKPVITVHSAKYGIFRAPASFVERVGNFILKKKSMAEWLELSNAKWERLSVSDGSISVRVVGEYEE